MVMAIDPQQQSAKKKMHSDGDGVSNWRRRTQVFAVVLGKRKADGTACAEMGWEKEEVQVWEEGSIQATPVEVCSANHSGCDELVPEVFGVSESNKGREWRWPSRIA